MKNRRRRGNQQKIEIKKSLQTPLKKDITGAHSSN